MSGVSVRRALKWAAIAVAGVFLVHFARSVDWSETWAAMRRASPALLLVAALVNAVTLLARSARWSIFLGGIGVRSRGLAVRSAVIGSGLSNILPASGGDPVRVLFVARRAGMSRTRVLAALALDRLTDAASYATLLVLAPLAIPLPAVVEGWRIPFVAVLAALAAATALAMRQAVRRERARGERAIDADLAASEQLRGVRGWLTKFSAGLAALRSWSCLTPAFGLSLLAWGAQALTYHLVAVAAHFPVTFGASAAAMLAVNASFFVQATPGNIGVVQFIYALAMAAFGYAHHTAIGVALLIQAVQILPVTAAALILAPEVVFGRRGGAGAVPAGDADRR